MYRRLLASAVLLALVITTLVWPRDSRAAAMRPEDVPDSLPPYSVQYYAETGHAAVNGFQEYWRNTPNALFTLGYPISKPFIEESFTEPGKFYRVQYFERAVLEEHPENAGTPFYILGRLMGNQIIKGREAEAPFQAVGDPGDGTWFAETGHTLRNDPAPFRNFWQRNGGLQVFGYPKSEAFQEQNQATGEVYWVQYFERNRMEWHPDESDPKFQILLGLLGNEYRALNHQNNQAFVSVSPQQALPRPFVYGYNAILYGDWSTWQDRQRVLQLAKDSGAPWIRQQVRWMDLHDKSGAIFWGELDRIVDDSHNAGVQLLLSVVAAPSWTTPDGKNGMPARQHFGTYAYFMGEMAKRYQGKVQAYEIWNEQNLAHENAGRVANAGYYMDMLVEASKAIKANDPRALVVSGGPSATETNEPNIAISDVTFSRQMFADPRFRDHVDIVGVHPGGASNPPDTMWPSNPGPGPNFVTSREFYFRRIEDIRQAMLDHGLGDRQIWVTEFGWATKNNTPGYEFGNQISSQQQAEWIVRAFEIARYEYAPYVGGMFLWQLNFAVPWKATGNELHEQASYGVINGDWSPRPAYDAIKNMPKN